MDLTIACGVFLKLISNAIENVMNNFLIERPVSEILFILNLFTMNHTGAVIVSLFCALPVLKKCLILCGLDEDAKKFSEIL